MGDRTRVALYARVSTDDKGQDPYNQMDIIRRIADQRGYEVVGEFADHASGKDPNRPEWQKVMDLARRHRIDAIMALRLDRVMRSVQHLCRAIEDLKDYKVRLLFSDMEFDPDSPNSVLTINILSSIAQWEREMLSARTCEGLDRRRRQGVKLGRRARDDIPTHKVALMRSQGMSWREIAKQVGIPESTLRTRCKASEAPQNAPQDAQDGPQGDKTAGDVSEAPTDARRVRRPYIARGHGEPRRGLLPVVAAPPFRCAKKGAPPTPPSLYILPDRASNGRFLRISPAH